jgi:methyl-accepting chemotaxis protein
MPSRLFLLLFVLFLLTPAPLLADGFTQRDRDMLTSLQIRVDEMGKRLDTVDTRFVELREDMNNRFSQMITFFWILATIFSAMAAAMISLTIWDRRTTLRPVENKIQEVNTTTNLNAENIQRLVSALRELAQDDTRLAKTLRSFHLL